MATVSFSAPTAPAVAAWAVVAADPPVDVVVVPSVAPARVEPQPASRQAPTG